MNFTAEDARKINEEYRRKVLIDIETAIQDELHINPAATSVEFAAKELLSENNIRELLDANFGVEHLEPKTIYDSVYYYKISW